MFLLSISSEANFLQWNNGRIIALLVVAFILIIAFVLIQVWKPDQAMVPPRIFTQRSIFGGFWVSCCVGAHQTLFSKSTSILMKQLLLAYTYE
jgi:hypothetical protein